jgi:hypothetical protein
MILTGVALAAVVWTGTAQVDVMIREPGGEHPYRTEFTLEYVEVSRASMLDASGSTGANGVRLVPRLVAIKVHHEVRGLLNCSGDAQEVVAGAPAGELVPKSGAYELVLPRAVGAYACGSKRNARDRWVVVGSGLFHPAGEIDTTDVTPRNIKEGRMAGAFESVDPAYLGSPVRHEYHVTWNLERRVEP